MTQSKINFKETTHGQKRVRPSTVVYVTQPEPIHMVAQSQGPNRSQRRRMEHQMKKVKAGYEPPPTQTQTSEEMSSTSESSLIARLDGTVPEAPVGTTVIEPSMGGQELQILAETEK